MTRLRTLADELAELANPAPQGELDPEAADITDGDQLGDSNDELQQLAQGTAGRRVITTEIAIDEGEYIGRRTTRAALFGNEQQDASNSSSDDDPLITTGRIQQVSPRLIDVSRYPTMFVNGHMGGPGRDDPTDSSSSDFGDSEMDEDEQPGAAGTAEQQQQQQQQHAGPDVQHMQVEQQQEQPQQLQQQQHNQQQRQHQQHPQYPAEQPCLQQWHDVQQQQQLEQPGAASVNNGPVAGSSSIDDKSQRAADCSAEQPDSQQEQESFKPGCSSQGTFEEDSDDQEQKHHSGDFDGLENHQQLQQQEQHQSAAQAEGRQLPNDFVQQSGNKNDEGSCRSKDGREGSSEDQALADDHNEGTRAANVAAGVTALLGDDAEMCELEREAAAVRQQAEQQRLAAAAHGEKNAAKAAGVRAQQRLWGAALEMRIRLQQAVTAANVLPRPQQHAALVAADKQVAQRFAALLSSCQATLESMLQLHQTLVQQHPAAAASLAAAAAGSLQQSHQLLKASNANKHSRAAAGLDTADEQQQQHQQAGNPVNTAGSFAGSCKSAAAAWAAVDGIIESLAGFRDTALDKWHRRTVLSSGTAALRGSSGLRALQQSVSSQVAALMVDKARLITRTQLPVQLAPRPLGQPATAAAGQPDADGDDEVDDHAQPGGGVRRSSSNQQRDPETFDEGDFYQQLLKELTDSAPTGSLPDQLAAVRPAKRRKVVDRRASKGRKIRYHTIEKLVGFTAPAELVLPPFAEQLFRNLFCHER